MMDVLVVITPIIRVTFDVFVTVASVAMLRVEVLVA